MGPKVPQIKGVAIRSVLAAVERCCAPGTRQKMLGRLPDHLASAVERENFFTAFWYPLAHLRSIFGAIMVATGRDVEVVRALSREATRDDFRGVYRLATFVLSPEYLMGRSPRLFTRYYDTGTLTVPEARAGRCRATYSGCIGFDFVLWEDVIAGSSAILEACGARDIHITRLHGGGDGDTELEVLAEWR
jgi:hypothetical protein